MKASVRRPWGFYSDPPIGLGRAQGSPQLKVVSEHRFRRFYKMILKIFANDFEIVDDMHCICI